MTESAVERYAASANGRVHLDATPAPSAAAAPRRRDISSMIVPAILIVTALIVLRRMQRGNYA